METVFVVILLALAVTGSVHLIRRGNRCSGCCGSCPGCGNCSNKHDNQ